MTPKLVFTAFFIAFFSLCQAQETTHLFGDVTVQLKKKALTANYNLTNIKVNSAKMSFMLHEDFDIEQVYLNGDPIASSKNGRFCESCKVHTIWIDRALTPQDTVKIVLAGNLENFSGEGVNFRDQLFQAGTASKWYPVILPEAAKRSDAPFSSNAYAYTYDLQIKCGDCKTIGIAATTADDNHFQSEIPSSDIRLNLSTQKLDQQVSAQDSQTADSRISTSKTK
ncbi:MAG TPA: hypothetical protein ENH91_02295 [Leeuwenhoekiella sp.]|nr:hypothetical protein [Leeuwenhoekiella sp.]